MSLKDPQDKFSALREQAESLMQNMQIDGDINAPKEIRHLLHELSVHQVELEMQNDELRKAQNEAEQARIIAERSHEQFFQLFNLAPIGYLTLDAHGIIEQCNQVFCEMTGLSESKLIGRTLAQLVYPEDRLLFDVRQRQLSSNPDKSQIEFRLLHASLSPRYVRLIGRKLPSLNQASLLITLSDIQELKLAEEKLKLSASVFEVASEGILITDENNKILTINNSFTQITGYSLDELVGKNPDILSSGKQDKDFYHYLWSRLNLNGHWEGEIWNRRKNGEIYPEWLSIHVLRDFRGNIHRHIGVFSDLTKQKTAQEIIKKQANYDGLTGLPNRILFMDRLTQAIKYAHREKRLIALMFLDLDHFKDINDTLGHHIGDVLLKETALRLCSCVRESDTVARLSGDEFTLILSELVEPADADRVANGILQKLASAFQLGEEIGYITVSIGITLYPNDGVDANTLLKNADQAMYDAKHTGRNRFSYFTPAMQEAAYARKQIIYDLRRALVNSEFSVVYQPILNLVTGKIYKAEALMRWEHPVHGFIDPSTFIPISEETGMIVAMGDWIFRKATEQAALWKKTLCPDFNISINKSPIQFVNDDVVCNSWFEHLKELGLPGKHISIEITEGLLLNSNSTVNSKLLAFHDAGIQVSLDDFGTGYSSLSYLKKFSIDFIKIDRSFVHNLASSSDDQVMCEIIILMAHKLGIKVIAEGIETHEQLDFLVAAGCDYGQGFLFSKPILASEFEEFLLGQPDK
jgi:diguanylate cyclase (GGDEF)-like protein/PAS domain S-box-containing protein